MVYHDLPLGWLTLCKPASMQLTLRINREQAVIDAVFDAATLCTDITAHRYAFAADFA